MASHKEVMKLCEDVNARLGLSIKVVKLDNRDPQSYLVYFSDKDHPLTKRWLSAREAMIVMEGIELFVNNVPGTGNILERVN